MQTKILLCFSALLGLFGCTSGFSNDALDIPYLEQVDCWFDSGKDWPDSTCFFMHVHEVHGNPASKVIAFPIVKFSHGTSAKTPVLDLGGGGPGSPAGLDRKSIGRYIWLNYAQLSLALGRDLYLIDPRGAGMARPLMNCPAFIAQLKDIWKRPLSFEQEIDLTLQATRTCAQRWSAAGHQAAAYNSLSVVKDLELLRNQLGVKAWNLVGVSYASRYALTYAREFPDYIDAMVLDGAVFPQIRYAEMQARNYSLAIKKAFAVCNRDARCREEFPDIENRFWNLLAQLNEKPLHLSVSDPYTYERVDVALTGDRFLAVIFNALYDHNFHPTLPGIIKSTELGNTDLIAPRVRYFLEYLLDPSLADVLLSSHFCYEEYPFVDDEKRKANNGNYHAYLMQRQVQQIDIDKVMCNVWLKGQRAPEIEGLPVQTAVPTLFLHGDLDPVLPVEDLEEQMQYFQNWALETFSDISHSVIASSACAERTAGMFFEHGLKYKQYVNCW